MKTTTLRRLLYGLALLLIAATWPRDDTGTPAGQCSYIGSDGTPTLCSTTSPLPTGTAGTLSSTDPTGWGKNWFAASGVNTGGSSASIFTGDVTAQLIHANGTGTALDVRTSVTGGRIFALTETGAGDACASVNAGIRFGGNFLIGCNGDGVNDGYFRSGSGFETWTRVDLPSFTGVSVTNIAGQGSTVLATGTSGATGIVCRSTNSGTSFAACTDFGAIGVPVRQGLASPTASTWLVLDSSGGLARSTDDGSTFGVNLAGLAGNGAVKCLTATVCLVGEGVNIRRSTNAGATWTTVFSGATGTTFRAFVDFGSGVVNAFNTNSVYRSADFGVTWQFQVALPAGFSISSSGIASTSTREGRGTVTADFGGGNASALYSPIVGAGETLIAGQNGNRWEINASGEGETSTVIRDSTQANAAGVTAGGRLQIHALRSSFPISCVTPAANTAAVVTVTGIAGQNITLHDYIAFYDVAPATPQVLTVADAATTIWRDVVGAALTPTRSQFHAAFLLSAGNTLTVTLPAGGVGVSGTLCVARRQDVF